MAEVPLNIVGPSNETPDDCERSINLYPRTTQSQGEKSQRHLVSGPGLSLLVDTGAGPSRGFLVANARLFSVHGSGVYEIFEAGTFSKLGTIASSSGKVSMATLLTTLVIGDGLGYYALDLDTNAVSSIVDAPVGRFCVFFDQRILYQGQNGQVFYSELNDPTNIPGLNFFTAEDLPDDISAIIPTEDKLALIGVKSTEWWFDAGDADNPFQRIPGSVVLNGTVSADTVIRTDNAVFMVGQNDDGDRQVFRIQGFQHLIISTHAVEGFLKTATNLSAFSYQEDGHTFYELNADEGTWVFDIGEKDWNERAWLNPIDGSLERARPEIHAFAFGMHIVSDYENGKLYRQATDIYSDDGNPLLRQRTFRGPYQDGRAMVVNELFVDMRTGVGLDGTGQGVDPKVMMQYSVDGGNAWSYEMQGDLGKIGDRTAKVRFSRLGSGTDWAFRVGVSDPVPVSIYGGVARGRVGRRG